MNEVRDRFISIKELGYEWYVPVEFIAAFRATNYIKQGYMDKWKEEFYFAYDNPEYCADWMKEHMEWKDIVKVAVRRKRPSGPIPTISNSTIKIVDLSGACMYDGSNEAMISGRE